MGDFPFRRGLGERLRNRRQSFHRTQVMQCNEATGTCQHAYFDKMPGFAAV